MKHKVLHTATICKPRSRTSDVRLIQLYQPTSTWTRTFRFTYDAGNAFERFYGELFNGDEFVPIFTMRDLGVIPDDTAYAVLDEMEIKTRIANLISAGVKFINLLY
jgi:hypothetical protein